MTTLEYNRLSGRRQYLSIQKHRHNARNDYNKWKSFDLEKKTFDNADYGDFNNVHSPERSSWTDSENNLWGFLENYDIVGTNNEQFGYFPVVTNNFDRWHGYPIIPFTKGYEIDEKLLHYWISEGYINEDDIPRLKKRKRL
ncbi:hypothetical protein [Psychrobacillus soli]|uniref:Uncharacterized protein n=1 Tax=Psychrobacillus soli TaxID=1543965 RepID=A0A544TBF7_9BACI|nr:hypothetical protein [Psychrobacillus soli]TQR14728.1 hypothetical protein FG383_10425 [Psychrobacillus soli]